MSTKIKIADFIKSIADMTLEVSVIGNGETGSKKSIEEAGQLKLEGSNITEILVAEIFASQIPLSKFLNSKDRNNLMDLYFLEIYHLVLNEYKYFKSKEELVIFEKLIQVRFQEYYKILNDSKTDTFVALGGEIAKSLIYKEPMWPLFPMTFGMILSSKMVGINDFIKESSEKFEVEFN